MQQIEPEKRTAFIKAALRQVLLPENEAEVSIDDAHLLQEDVAELETFSLESLFSERVEPTSHREPWDHLLHTMVGIEEDEAVIAAIRQVALSEVQEEVPDNLLIKTMHSEQPVDEQSAQLDSVRNQEFELESLHVETPLASTGFEYMMKHIIGTEEDEGVLKILRGGR
ncbi:MAG: hypothetical protein P4L69_04360 [Desulfosporosinus sp.]|nr:hypothetical protein [Desulfosporosinus sp.]